jgi:hypothetical protein
MREQNNEQTTADKSNSGDNRGRRGWLVINNIGKTW